MIFVIRQIVYSLFRHHFSAQLFCPVTPLLHHRRDILNLIHVSELDANKRDLQLIPKQDIPGETRACPSACIHIHSSFYSCAQTCLLSATSPCICIGRHSWFGCFIRLQQLSEFTHGIR